MCARYKSMTDEEVLELLEQGCYTVDPITAEVRNGNGKVLTVYKCHKGYSFVRLYCGNTRRGIAVHKLNWMNCTGTIVPFGFEVHHWDEDIDNNEFDNLYCWHKTDHRKHHAKTEDAPF